MSSEGSVLKSSGRSLQLFSLPIMNYHASAYNSWILENGLNTMLLYHASLI